MRLRELQAAFAGYVAGTAAAAPILPFVRDHGGASGAQRLAVHGGTFPRRSAERLARGFPVTATLLGPRGLARAVRGQLAWIEASAPARPHLFRAWPDFLRLAAPLPDRPDLADVAALELARNDVSDAADTASIGAEALVAAAPEGMVGLRLRFVEALAVIHTSFDVSELWAAVDAGVAAPPPVPSATDLLVWRPGPKVLHAVLSPPEARALRAARQGAPLVDMCAAFAGEPRPDQAAYDALAGWFSDGLVAGVVPREQP